MNTNKHVFTVLMFASAIALPAGVISRDWAKGKLTLKLDDGSAEIEWITPVAFRVSRSWGGVAGVLPNIPHEAIAPTLEDVGQTISMRTRYITVDVDRENTELRVKSGETLVSTSVLVRNNDAVELRLGVAQDERFQGGGVFGPEGRQGLLFTSKGYGVFVRSPEHWAFDRTDGVVRTTPAKSIDYMFYYGPTPKEIFEQHAGVMSAGEVKADALDLLTRAQLPKQAIVLRNWPNASVGDAFHRFISDLIAASLSGVIYPAIDVSDFDYLQPSPDAQRFKDLCSMLPIVFRSSGEGGIEAATRLKWRPYLITYLREAYDRGYPLIRPLPMQFSRDADSDKQPDVFMLGDEVLLAPASGPKRKLDLPRGSWTDFRTNTEYRGNQTIEVDAPAGQVPMFVRNGWIVPLELQSKMELHYFPDLGGEFFLWEPEQGENSQFHAAPAGDYLRVEVETKVRRTYEWVLHHTKAPREVAEESGAYQKADRREALKPGMWWHDGPQNNLHVMMRAEANTDRIVNISF
jgi:hypothetical protein